MKPIYFLLVILFTKVTVNASPAEPLGIGDKVPALPLNGIVNAAYKKSSTKEWQGKLLILDFMATTCKGCIMALPRLDSLQAKYKDRVQIFLVTYEDAATVKAFIARNHIGQNVHLPFITSDTLLDKYFPHTWLSHEVWINSDQEVMAITEPEYVNDKNVAEALTSKTVNWPVKIDFELYDDSRPFLAYSDTHNFYFKKPASAFYTFLSGYINTRAISFLFNKDSLANVQRFCITNYPIVQMYQLTYNAIFLPPGHIQLNVKNRSHYMYEQGVEYLDVWNAKNRYCYEALLPLTMSMQAVEKKVVEDLDNYFGLQASFKKQEALCLVLKDTAQQKDVSDSENKATKDSITLRDLLYVLDHNQYGTPVLNESSAGDNMVLPLSGNESLEEINAVLANHGLVFLKMRRTTDILTISETPSSNQLITN